MRVSDTAKYGKFYWCVKSSLSQNGEIYVMGDTAQVTECGALVITTSKECGSNLVIAPGKWTAVFAASLIDGAAVAVEHWKGEVLSRGE